MALQRRLDGLARMTKYMHIMSYYVKVYVIFKIRTAQIFYDILHLQGPGLDGREAITKGDTRHRGAVLGYGLKSREKLK